MGSSRRLLVPRTVAFVLALAASAITATMPGAAQAGPRGSTSAARSAAIELKPPATCVIHSLPSFIAQGEIVSQGEFSTAATVADVVEVECNPSIYGTGSKIRITANQLFSRCKGNLTWYVPNPFRTEQGNGVSVELDADGNATVALLAGPGCMVGESLITAHMQEEPFESFTTAFSVLAPMPTTPGVFALPATQVEDALSSGVATIIEAEFENGSEQYVHLGSEELFHRCRVPPHLHWIRMNRSEATGVSEVRGVQLDNDGNAFVIAIGDASCAPGPSLIEADLEAKPFTTYTTTFTVLPPQPTAEPSFTIEKSQEIAGSGGGFTTSTLRGSIGQTVDYEIAVRNTGSVAETFSGFTDAHCDPLTIAGGPASSQLAPGQSTTYTCQHALTSVGAYTNEATVTGTTVGGTPVTHTSNQVVVEVPAEPAFTIEKRQEIMGSAGGFTTSPLTGAIGQTVDYQIVVKNTGNEGLTFSNFNDAQCDKGTIAGGPGEAPVAPGSSTTYTCSHVLTSTGPYVNKASVTGTPQGQAAIMHTSNPVEVNVPAAGVNAPQVMPRKGPPPSVVVKKFCAAALPAFRIPSGPKRRPFMVQISSAGIQQITFYLDGHKLRSLKQSQAKGGKFSVRIDLANLSYGPHTLSIKALPRNPDCPPSARSAVFVRPYQPVRVIKNFTG
jgi:hypothetical protein